MEILSVGIRIGSTGHVYKLSKDLICDQCPYFAVMLSGDFTEVHERLATLEEIDGVVSERSFISLVQWMYVGRVGIDRSKSSPNEIISTLIEFARFADIYDIFCMEHEIGEHIKATIIANRQRAPGTSIDKKNTYHITSENIVSASHLPDSQPVRSILAAASVEEYLSSQHSAYRFKKET